MRSSLLAALAALATVATAVNAGTAHARPHGVVANTAGNAASSALTYVTAETASQADLSHVSPAVVNCPAMACAGYQASVSCLGPYGPISAYGPLGSLGPLSGAGNWFGGLVAAASKAMYNPADKSDGESWAKQYGALSGWGPLGANGPLGDSYYTTMPRINDFAAQLAAQGVWTVLGPLGPLGALGPLGPLGPRGPHGFTTDANGGYLTRGSVQRTVDVDFSNAKRTYPLYEVYKPEYARSLAADANDVSWMTQSNIGVMGSHTYHMTATDEQYVTVLVVPYVQLDKFTVELSAAGKKIASSDADSSMSYINWIQAKVPARTQLTVTVRHKGQGFGNFLPPRYFLYVTGSTKYFTSTSIRGPHIRSYSL